MDRMDRDEAGRTYTRIGSSRETDGARLDRQKRENRKRDYLRRQEEAKARGLDLWKIRARELMRETAESLQLIAREMEATNAIVLGQDLIRGIVEIREKVAEVAKRLK